MPSLLKKCQFGASFWHGAKWNFLVPGALKKCQFSENWHPKVPVRNPVGKSGCGQSMSMKKQIFHFTPFLCELLLSQEFRRQFSLPAVVICQITCIMIYDYYLTDFRSMSQIHSLRPSFASFLVILVYFEGPSQLANLSGLT